MNPRYAMICKTSMVENKQSVGTQDCRRQFSKGEKGGHESETSNISLNGRRRLLEVVALTGSDSWKYLKIIFLKL